MAKTVFIIEDEMFLQGLEATRLKNEGYDILTAANGEEVNKIFENKPKIDLVLLDLMLPDIDGFTILEKIRQNENFKDLKVIIFSNLSEEKDVERGKKLGATDFMVKSNFDLGQLTEKVKELIGK